MINDFFPKNGNGSGKLKKYLKKRPVVSDESKFAKNNITNSSKIANEFNRHFISIAKQREEISIKSKHKYSVDIKNPNSNYSFNSFNPYNQWESSIIDKNEVKKWQIWWTL